MHGTIHISSYREVLGGSVHDVLRSMNVAEFTGVVLSGRVPESVEYLKPHNLAGCSKFYCPVT